MNEKEHHELNCWIAEHVMGWVKHIRSTKTSPVISAFSEAYAVFENWEVPGGLRSLPKFTTDPAFARLWAL